MPPPSEPAPLSRIPSPGQDSPGGPRLQPPTCSHRGFSVALAVLSPLPDPPPLPLIQLFIE